MVTENLGRFTDQSGHPAEFLPFPSNEYRDKMVASFVAGTEFDVAYVRDSYLAEWASAGWILPITDLEGADELLAELPAGIIEQMSYDGEVYGLPYYSGLQTMAYNAAHLEAAGGPADATNVLGWAIYTETFRKLDFGAGSSIAMLLGAITLGMAILFYVFLDRGTEPS